MAWNETELENTSTRNTFVFDVAQLQTAYKEHEDERGYTQQPILETSKWGENPSTSRMTALALSYSMAEYAVSSLGNIIPCQEHGP